MSNFFSSSFLCSFSCSTTSYVNMKADIFTESGFGVSECRDCRITEVGPLDQREAVMSSRTTTDVEEENWHRACACLVMVT